MALIIENGLNIYYKINNVYDGEIRVVIASVRINEQLKASQMFVCVTCSCSQTPSNPLPFWPFIFTLS